MLFKIKFNELTQEAKRDIVSISTACEEVSKSDKFAFVLNLILSIGNFMHAGTRNERAIGFEISFLPKLMGIRSVDSKLTLLHFIANQIETEYPDKLKFYEDFLHLDKAAKGW